MWSVLLSKDELEENKIRTQMTKKEQIQLTIFVGKEKKIFRTAKLHKNTKSSLSYITPFRHILDE